MFDELDDDELDIIDETGKDFLAEDEYDGEDRTLTQVIHKYLNYNYIHFI